MSQIARKELESDIHPGRGTQPGRAHRKTTLGVGEAWRPMLDRLESVPAEVEEEFLRHVLEYETQEPVSLLSWLAKSGIEVPEPIQIVFRVPIRPKRGVSGDQGKMHRVVIRLFALPLSTRISSGGRYATSRN